jgi:large subunit ribosomal protein L30
MANKIKVKYIHSPIGRNKKQKDTVRCLGFTRLNQVKEFECTPALEGMVKKISHLVQVIES